MTWDDVPLNIQNLVFEKLQERLVGEGVPAIHPDDKDKFFIWRMRQAIRTKTQGKSICYYFSLPSFPRSLSHRKGTITRIKPQVSVDFMTLFWRLPSNARQVPRLCLHDPSITCYILGVLFSSIGSREKFSAWLSRLTAPSFRGLR